MLKEIALPFLRLGVTAFGGPAAHIAMMEDEFVRRRRWLSHQQFLDLLGATNLIPGPNSTEMAIHIGYQRAGWRGLLTGGFCFIVPAALMVTAMAWAYLRYGSLPPIQGMMYGIKPVIIAVIVQALWRLGRGALKSRLLVAVAMVATAAALLKVNMLAVLFGAGIVMAIVEAIVRRSIASAPGSIAGWSWPGYAALRSAGIVGAAAAPFSLSGLFLFFLKVGAVLYGSGYVLLAFLQSDLVDRLHWLTQSQLLDAVAIGQVTPGPVFTTATFIGYLLGGPKGAALATVAIFLPSFIFVAASWPLIPRIRRLAVTGAFLDGVNVGALALMAAVTVQLSRAAILDFTTSAIAALSAAILIFTRINSVWLIFAGALLGLAAMRLAGG
jgi:chromate transporter